MIESYNKEAQNQYNNKSLEACPGCSRTFLPDSLKIHMRSCLKNAASPVAKSDLGNFRSEMSSGSILSRNFSQSIQHKSLIANSSSRNQPDMNEP